MAEVFLLNELLQNLDKIHISKSGEVRIRNDFGLTIDNVLDWCKEKISDQAAIIERIGKSWFVYLGDYMITVDARRYHITGVQKRAAAGK